MDETTKRPSIDILKQGVIDIIVDGRELEPRHLQLIMAVLGGKTGNLWPCFSGERVEFAIKPNISGYKPIMKDGRPVGGKLRAAKTVLAATYECLKETLGSEGAYEKLSLESKERFGTALGVDSVKRYLNPAKLSMY